MSISVRYHNELVLSFTPILIAQFHVDGESVSVFKQRQESMVTDTVSHISARTCK